MYVKDSLITLQLSCNPGFDFQSSVLLHDKHGRSHEMFKLLTQYPDGLLAQVVEELRADGMLVHHKSTVSVFCFILFLSCKTELSYL